MKAISEVGALRERRKQNSLHFYSLAAWQKWALNRLVALKIRDSKINVSQKNYLAERLIGRIANSSQICTTQAPLKVVYH